MPEEAAWKEVWTKVALKNERLVKRFLNNCVVVTLENLFTANLNSLSYKH